MESMIAKLLHDFEQGRMNRRQLIQTIAVTAAAVAAGGATAGAAPAAAQGMGGGHGFQAVAVNHISYQVADYARTRDFYADLLGMKVMADNGHQCDMAFGETFLLPRNARDKSKAPLVDHFAITIADWDKDKVGAELTRRGLNPRPDTDDSFHIKDPDGYNLQISGKNMKAGS